MVDQHRLRPAWRRVRRAGVALGIFVSLGLASAAGLSLPDAVALARQTAPTLQAADAAVAAASAARPAAGTLPDPRLMASLENLPVAGADRWNPGRDPDTMQRLGLMQDVPNRAKRAARVQGAEARVERERAALVLAALTMAGSVWLVLGVRLGTGAGLSPPSGPLPWGGLEALLPVL